MRKLFVPVCAALGAIGLVGTSLMVFTATPSQWNWQPDQRHLVLSSSSLFFNHKIFYWHVAHAIMLFVAVGVSGVASIAFLARRKPEWDDVALGAAEVAVAFGGVVLITGSIWARAAWGVWWVWETRLTMSLLLWLTLVGYVLVRRFAGSSGERLAAGMAIFAMIGVPFIYTMVNADDHHPQAGPNGAAATLDPAMRPAFYLSMLTFLFWFLALVALRVRSARMEREVRELRERGLDAGLLS